MKRGTILVLILAVCIGIGVHAQDGESPLLDPEQFLQAVDLESSIASINDAIADPEALEELAGRVLVLDGVVASILLYSDDPADYYAEVELVSGRWDGVREVVMNRAYVVLADGRFAGRLAERAPREPDPDLVLRNDHILIAARLIDLTEDDMGEIVPLLLAYEIRKID
jgi:hypothetical protein